MQYVSKLNLFLIPYRMRALLALVLLATLVSFDLAIPHLIQRIIAQGIHDSQLGSSRGIFSLLCRQSLAPSWLVPTFWPPAALTAGLNSGFRPPFCAC